MNDDLRYPIGKCTLPTSPLRDPERTIAIETLAEAPTYFRAAVAGLSELQFDMPYRPGGWTIRQIVHHMPDSHMNAFMRCKLALTETNPTIKPYDQAAWAKLYDTYATPIMTSIALLDNLHDRWVQLFSRMRSSDFARTFHHPETGVMNLDQVLVLYAWHGRHHYAQIVNVRKQYGW